MRVALIDPSLFTWPYDHELAEALDRLGHQVDIFGKHLPDNERASHSSKLQQIFYAGFEREWVKALPHAVFLGLKGLSHPVSLMQLLQRLHRFRPDIIHFQWAPLPVVDQYFVGAFRRIAPTILTIHDSNPFNNNPGSRLQRLNAISILRRFDHLIVHTEQARARLIAHGIPSSSLALIPHGVLEQDSFTSLPAPVARADGRVTILLFGKLKPYKGADILLRAVAAMPDAAQARCHIHIVGKSYMDVAPLKRLATELGIAAHVTWDLRFIDNAEMAAIFTQADIVAMPYREIDASGVLMMALAAGRPIVASQIGLFAEMLQDGKHGFLVPSENVEKLAQALTTLVEDAPLRHQMGRDVLALKNAIPSWQEIARKTERIYAQLDLQVCQARPGHSDRLP